jgi:hypothetical protein
MVLRRQIHLVSLRIEKQRGELVGRRVVLHALGVVEDIGQRTRTGWRRYRDVRNPGVPGGTMKFR